MFCDQACLSRTSSFGFERLAILLAALVFMSIFLIPVTFVQGLTQLEKLSKTFPFLRGLLKKAYISRVVTGYLPSVILMLFLLLVPPLMMLFSRIEAPISGSLRQKSACLNVFFVNVLSGSVISQLNVISSIRDIPQELASVIPTQASFFMTYVFTSGWAGLACELMQVFTFILQPFQKGDPQKQAGYTVVAHVFPIPYRDPKTSFICTHSIHLFNNGTFNIAIFVDLLLHGVSHIQKSDSQRIY